MKLLEPSAHTVLRERQSECERVRGRRVSTLAVPSRSKAAVDASQGRSEAAVLMKPTRNWIFMYMTDRQMDIERKRESWICERANGHKDKSDCRL